MSLSRRTSPAALLLATLLLLLPAGRAAADVFRLNSGGQVEGRWVNRGESLKDPYRVETASGLVLSLSREAVTEVLTQRPEEMDYERLAPQVADTVDAQWKVAEWCRQKHLPRQRDVHLVRILQLDPEHLPARRALGYAQVDGQWLTRDEWKRSQGFEYYRGSWRIAQEIELLEDRHKRELAEKEWARKLRRLRDQLLTGRAAEARQELLQVKDPHAVPVLAELMAAEPFRAVKVLYIEMLAQIADGKSVELLLNTSLVDPDEEVRYACLKQIKTLDPPNIQGAYIKALGSTDNFVINRAAYALSQLGDKTAVAPLITALVTTHTFTYEPPQSSTGQTITTSFATGGPGGQPAIPGMPGPSGSGLSMGSKKTSVTERVPNQEVLSALIKLSGAPNYGYDQEAWRNWLESRQSAAALGGR